MDRNTLPLVLILPKIGVALRKESVDRNITLPPFYAFSKVALRKESVDRNVNIRVVDGSKSSVALRKESVDRNNIIYLSFFHRTVSLSARRAWIEIMIQHAEKKSTRQSLSARRAWIEITTYFETSSIDESLSARRAWIEIDDMSGATSLIFRRSPQGERG